MKRSIALASPQLSLLSVTKWPAASNDGTAFAMMLVVVRTIGRQHLVGGRVRVSKTDVARKFPQRLRQRSPERGDQCVPRRRGADVPLERVGTRQQNEIGRVDERTVEIEEDCTGDHDASAAASALESRVVACARSHRVTPVTSAAATAGTNIAGRKPTAIAIRPTIHGSATDPI